MPQDLRAVAFPKLDEGLLVSTLERYHTASLRTYRDGEVIFEAGSRDFKFLIVKSGRIEILDASVEPPRTLVVHDPGEFTGEVSYLTGGPSPVTAIARGDCQVYEVTLEELRSLLVQLPALGDTILQAFIARRQLLRESGDFAGVRVIGSRYSHDTFRVRDFLAKNRVLFSWLDIETDPHVKELLPHFGVSEADTPVVAWGRRVLRNPSNRQLAEALGIRRPVDRTVHDLVIVGAGPAGLAAAVYAASEGLRTLVVERMAAGGQAGTSMRIENYLGFPTGISGSELAERAVIQAHKFGACLSVATPATRLVLQEGYALLESDGGESIVAKCLLIASGADYRRLAVEHCERFEGTGVYYAATINEAAICRGQEAVVVGGGNSAGQAAVFLAEHARKVYLVVRGDDLAKNMSTYLVQRIRHTDNIEVLLDTEIREMTGDDGHLAAVDLVNTKTGEVRRVPTPAVFSFIGAVPRTDWLPPEIQTDPRGFVCTGPALRRAPDGVRGPRDPFMLETSSFGVFAAGDVRSGSVKRVSSAVGEGAMAVQFVHEHLKDR
jgi:thioredoxin reductase (NADPH)